MKVKVDMDKCEAYGECVFAAEDVFELDDGDETVTVKQSSPDESLRDDVEKAVEACPTSAISIED